MLYFYQRLEPIPTLFPELTVELSAEERTRSRYRTQCKDGQPVQLALPRGTVLRDGDLLRGDHGVLLQIRAKAESVLIVTAEDPIALLRAAYHLGNRHVPLEIGADYLRLEPDPVLAAMLRQMHLYVAEEEAPFQPEAGAYHSHSMPGLAHAV